MTFKNTLIFISTLLIPAFCFAEGQWGMNYIIWTIDFIQVFGLWTICAFIFLFVLKKIRKTGLSKKQKIIFWTLILFSAFINWSMITYDPRPTEGPIDSFYWHNKEHGKAMDDSFNAVEFLKGLDNQTISVNIKGRWYLNQWTLFHTLNFSDSTVFVDNNIDSVLTVCYSLVNDTLVTWSDLSSKRFKNKIILISEDTLVLNGFTGSTDTLAYSRIKREWKN